MIKSNEPCEIGFVDSSRISCFSRCEAKFFFQCILGLRKPDASMLPLDYGTCMHVVLPEMYKGDVEAAFAVWDNAWSKFSYGEEDKKRNTEVSRRRIVDFMGRHNAQNCPYHVVHFPFSAPTELISENEVPFLIDVGAWYPLCGRIDAVVEWKATHDLWAYDFKTSSELSPRYFDGFWHSPQACTYSIALAQITGQKIQGLMIEGMRISEKNIESQIGFVYVSEVNMLNFIEEVKLMCERMKQCSVDGLWHQNFALCSSYPCFGFPCYTCEYKILCDSGDWQEAARFYTKSEPFDPLKKVI